MPMQAFTNFINQRIELYRLMTSEPEKIPGKLVTTMIYDVAYEKEARRIMQETELPLLKTGECCFYMAESYKFGYNRYFPHVSVQQNLRQAAYWLLQAFIYNSRPAFIFLHIMVPECFIEGIGAYDMLNSVERVLIELSKLHILGYSIHECRKKEVVAYFIADQIVYPVGNITSAVAEVMARLEVIDRELESHQVALGKQN